MKITSISKSCEYAAWKKMRHRCSNPATQRFDRYGGRGIQVCAQWQNSFATFLADVGKRPSPHHSIDRINNDGNYEPDNVRWATHDQQINNRSNTKRIVFGGVTKTVKEWCSIWKTPYMTLLTEHRKGGAADYDRFINPPTKNPRIKNLNGRRFSRLFVLGFTGKTVNQSATWLCRCDCGNFTVVACNRLISKNTQSCGCTKNRPRPWLGD